MHRLHGKEQTDIGKLFLIETENGWMHSCKNGSITKGKFGDDYDFEFKASKENGCYSLRRNNEGLFGHFTIAGSNVIASAGIEVGKKLKYSFNCPLDDLQESFNHETPVDWHSPLLYAVDNLSDTFMLCSLYSAKKLNQDFSQVRISISDSFVLFLSAS